jgi:hypothetical protein
MSSNDVDALKLGTQLVGIGIMANGLMALFDDPLRLVWSEVYHREKTEMHIAASKVTGALALLAGFTILNTANLGSAEAMRNTHRVGVVTASIGAYAFRQGNVGSSFMIATTPFFVLGNIILGFFV